MAKSLVFLSHISQEQDLANAFKVFLEDSFLGLIEVFVSSNEESLPAGSKWLDSITHALRTCTVEILLCSARSIERRWINFEAGAGWVRGIPVIPICHSGLTRDALPPPLNSLQAANASDADHLRRVLGTVATALGSRTPTVNLDAFAERIKSIEETLSLWSQLEEFAQLLGDARSNLLQNLADGRGVKWPNCPDDRARGFLSFAHFLAVHEICRLEDTGVAFAGGIGQVRDLIFHPLSQSARILRSPQFKFRAS
ncbi:toll/interleukin-1 receptor domain-containing protein [Polyangium sp. 15x6]|uniref:toll/interleukin-1 receptor domain-containing protein n=1 Tax=Polyangium sp. 15x6 TaxID=3042687 RepID=UPI00249AE00D|nr:toll/interleukin-1 receptor domain-containing protein [Polyangium sp. 15x6]MDI3292062.1 toll/interleukin-1 receptor domain-containing protein [Polyangium sp. 15x6]